jgi:putative transposase
MIYYTTSTILAWQSLFEKEDNIQFLYDAWQFLKDDRRILLYSFVIMPNHIHWLYETRDPFKNEQIKHTFHSFTAKKLLQGMNDTERELFRVGQKNREFQVWKANSLSVEIFSQKFFDQKMTYIHLNPSRAGLIQDNESYEPSSCQSYDVDKSLFPFLTLKTFL